MLSTEGRVFVAIKTADIEINIAWWSSVSRFKRSPDNRLKGESDNHHATLISKSTLLICVCMGVIKANIRNCVYVWWKIFLFSSFFFSSILKIYDYGQRKVPLQILNLWMSLFFQPFPYHPNYQLRVWQISVKQTVPKY